MKMLIISAMPHYRNDVGQIVGWGPTAEEINHLALIFDEIVHIGFMYNTTPLPNCIPYNRENIKFVPAPPTGGSGIKHKFEILAKIPEYSRMILQNIKYVDIVHVRCPANISLVAIILLSMLKNPRMRWVKYAGNWRPLSREPWSYTFQRWWLNRGLHRGMVTINGNWLDNPRHVMSFYNPSLTEKDLIKGRNAFRNKKLESPYKLLFAGRLETEKGIGRVLKIASALHKREIDFSLDILGDGVEREYFENLVRDQNLSNKIFFHGWVSKTNLSQFYANAHFFIFPTSASEGWPKVLSEAMAYGVVPLAGAVSAIPRILKETGAGISLPPENVAGYVQTIIDYVNNPDKWRLASQAGFSAAPKFTYFEYTCNVRKMFVEQWGVKLP